MVTLLSPAMPAINRLELVPIKVIEPASVVTWVMGSSSSRADTPRDCSSSLLAGTSMATIGVVLIKADITPIGPISRRRACRAVLTVASNLAISLVTIPVCTTPLAITSMPPTVMTPVLLSPENKTSAGATRVRPARASPAASARTGGILPDVIAASVATTMIAAQMIMRLCSRQRHVLIRPYQVLAS